MKQTRGWGGAVALALAVTLAPGCAAEGEEEDPSFDGDDMREAIEGTWTGSVTAAGGAEKTMELRLAYVPPAKQAACGYRELRAGRPRLEPQCTTESVIGLTGEMTVAGGELSAAQVSGSFMVSGTQMGAGYVEARASQPSPPPDSTMLERSFSAYTEGDELVVSLEDEPHAFRLTRK